MPAPVADDSTRLADRAAHADAAAAPVSARAAARGFTLLEIVLVMAIIALIYPVALLITLQTRSVKEYYAAG